jgi:hypothetical protein
LNWKRRDWRHGTSQRQNEKGGTKLVHRDWYGHFIQGIGIVLATTLTLGVPALIWANTMTATVATLRQQVERQDRDITEGRQFQTLITGQQLEINKQLTKIDTQLGDMKDRLPSQKR